MRRLCRGLRLGVTLLLGAWLLGCSSPASSLLATPTAQPPATLPLVSTPTNTVEAHATPTHPAENSSPSPSPASTGEPEPQPTAEPVAQCADTILTFNAEDGAKGYVRWRLDNGTYSIVAPVEEGNGVHQVMRPPDPAGPLAIISVTTDNGRPSVAANVLVNVATGSYRVLGSAYSDNPKYLSAWLPDERLVWIDDQGETLIGSMGAQTQLHAPARMTDLWFVPPDRLLVRDEGYRFWYYSLTDSVWSQLPAGQSEKIDTQWIESAAVSDDGRTVFFFYQHYSAILSNDSGTIEILTPSDLPPDGYYSIWVTGPFVPPQQIKDTSYWFLQNQGVFREIAHTTYLPRSTTVASTEISYVSTGFVVDSRTGAVLGHEALGIPAELAIYNSTLSPDRTQLAVEVIEAIETLQTNAPRVAQTWFYSFATGEPRLERMEDGAFGGWEGEGVATPDALLECAQQEITVELGASAKE